MSRADLGLDTLFGPPQAAQPGPWREQVDTGPGGAALTLDHTGAGGPVCATLRVPGALRLGTPPGYSAALDPAGGYRLHGAEPGAPGYWLPLAPRQVQRDAQGRLLQLQPAPLAELTFEGGTLQLGFAPAQAPLQAPAEPAPAGGTTRALEAVVWRLPPGLAPLPPGALERAPWFTLGSHTVIQGRADVYRHLVDGTVFENRLAWPNRWRVFSENDAHSLHLILGGLAAASGDPLLHAMRRQLLLAVLARQAGDGGFHHGEWTELMESHYRLHCSAMHLMMDALAERPDPAVQQALGAAAAFLARQAVPLSFGHWLLHDELEHSVEKMKRGPFKWVPSTVFGKAESNMLVLNSHLDGVIALDRYAQLTGDSQYAALVQSARGATTAVLGLRGAEPLYRLVFWLVGLTFLPTPQAAALPLWQRALKRLAWQHLIPRLPDLKARWPRLVMPGGYIARELTLRTWAHDYHAINLMDLARYLRRFDEPAVRQALVQGLAYTRRSGLLQRWAEMPYQKYALGFWAETLALVCGLLPEPAYRQWLAEAMLALEDLGLGLPPSLLGANAEAVPPADQLPCPSPADARLRVANLGRRGAPELLVLNPTAQALPLAWAAPPPPGLRWQAADGREFVAGAALGPRAWVWARPAA
ncbi:MAG: hypothetical protein KGJ24_13555 [Burkholderiales bacterium]|nr:hypothetical protein [Burkholderiales bacterium]